jgi:GNAT superfamily N-acetyltransferase
MSIISVVSVLSVTTLAQQQEFCTLAPSLNSTQIDQQQADKHLIAYVAGHAVARCSLWWRSAPSLPDRCPGQRIGCIGHYSATDRLAAAELLKSACAELAAAGCTLAVGPLDGSTFRSYRFVTQRSYQGTVRPPFLLEPDNPDSWPADFTAVGFQPWIQYDSALAALQGDDPRLEDFAPLAATHGIQLRTLDPDASDPARFDKELARIYPLVISSFAANPLFSPISYVEFTAQYTPVRKLLSPELVILAERAGELIGFLFALPDFAQAQRGETIDTVILKTLAVLPSMAGLGLGSLLAATLHTKAYQLGYRWAIHALMHLENHSHRISSHNAQPFRGYTLFARTLKPDGFVP